MVYRLFFAFVRDLAQILTSGKESTRADKVWGSEIGATVMPYLLKHDGGAIKHDIQHALLSERGSIAVTGLTKLFADILVGNLMYHLDTLPLSFYLETKEFRKKQAQKYITGTSALHEALKYCTWHYEYHDIQRSVIAFLGHVGRSVSIVQTAVDPTTEQKQQIRSDILKDNSCAVFYTEPDLIGGIRIITDSTIRDASWRSHIHSLITIGR